MAFGPGFGGGFGPGFARDGGSPPVDALTFVGPNIANETLLEDLPISARNFASRFESPHAITYTIVGTLPVGLSLSSAGVLTGTPTTQGLSSNLKIRANDGVDTLDSNTFSINVVAQSVSAVHRIRSRFGLGLGLG